MWHQSLDLRLINDIYTLLDESFINNICDNNFQYLKNNYKQITNIIVQQDCFLIACAYSNNIEIIDYIKDSFSINTKKIYTHTHGENLLLVKYLIENKNIPMQVNSFDNFKFFIPIIQNYKKFNLFLSLGTNKFGIEIILDQIIDLLNPLMLNDRFCSIFKIKPFNTSFDIFCKNADRLNCKISIGWIYKNEQIENIKKKYIDFTKESEPLFVHNEITFHGAKKIVYDAMYLLDSVDPLDNLDIPILNGEMPKYLIIIYLQSIYDHQIDIDDILKEDFKQFIKFIDQYPTKMLTIDLIEEDMIIYMNNNKIIIDEYFINICKKYQLKYMYLYFEDKLNYLASIGIDIEPSINITKNQKLHQ